MPGQHGAPGQQGARGEPGAIGAPGLPGSSAASNWKQCAWKNDNSELDDSKISVCFFGMPFVFRLRALLETLK